MADIFCKGCGAVEYVKNGIVRGLQRYRCKSCGCNFTVMPLRGKHPSLGALAILLYGMDTMNYRMIAHLLGISHVSVYQWIRAEAKKIPEPTMPADIALVMLDEVHHFLKKDRKIMALAHI